MPPKYPVHLEESEAYLIASVGCFRRINGSMYGKVASRLVDPSKDDWTTDIEAAGAECACAKELGLFWSGPVNTFKNADVGNRIQVKYTQWTNGHLQHWLRNRPEDLYVLVTGKCPDYVLHGYMAGVEIRSRPMKSEKGWWVAQEDLHDINDLRNPAAAVWRQYQEGPAFGPEEEPPPASDRNGLEESEPDLDAIRAALAPRAEPLEIDPSEPELPW